MARGGWDPLVLWLGNLLSHLRVFPQSGQGGKRRRQINPGCVAFKVALHASSTPTCETLSAWRAPMGPSTASAPQLGSLTRQSDDSVPLHGSSLCSRAAL